MKAMNCFSHPAFCFSFLQVYCVFIFFDGFYPMSTNSEVGKLLSANSHLSKLEDPFGSYYAYYMLAEKLQIKLEEFFNSNNNSFVEEISNQLPTDASAYICHKSERVKNESTINLKSLMLGFLGRKLRNSKLEEIQRPAFEGLDWEILDLQRKRVDETWASNDRADRDRRIVDFWRRARNCNPDLNQSLQGGHTNLDLMDLIAACSGYRDFSDFLQRELGKKYDPDKDNLLQELRTALAQPAEPTSKKTETEQLFSNHLVSYLQRAMWIFRPNKQKKKKGLNQIKVRSNKPPIREFFTKEIALKLTRFTPILLLILLGCLGAFMLIGRAKEAHVYVVLTTKYLHFQIAQPTTLRSTGKFMMGSRDHFSVRNAVYTLDYPFSDTLPVALRIKPALHEHVGIEHIKLPKDSNVTIETPTPQDLYIRFSDSEGLNGFIPIDHSIVYSPEEVDSVIYGENPSGTGINFHAYKDVTNEISLINADDFEWPSFKVKSTSFGQLKQDQVEYGIESGQINFLKSGKHIQLNPQDLFSITFEHPVTIVLKYNEGLVSLQFAGTVSSIFAGPDILGRSVFNNRMPKLWEEYKEVSGISLLLVIVFLIPAIMMLKFRTRQVV
jgi:hypothetical protein